MRSKAQFMRRRPRSPVPVASSMIIAVAGICSFTSTAAGVREIWPPPEDILKGFQLFLLAMISFPVCLLVRTLNGIIADVGASNMPVEQKIAMLSKCLDPVLRLVRLAPADQKHGGDNPSPHDPKGKEERI